MAVLNVAIIKAKESIEIDTSLLPDEIYQEALLQGLKVLANRGMSKINKLSLGSDDEVKKEALLKAKSNLEDLYAGKVKKTGAKKEKSASGVVMTEARRIARNLVKDEMRRQGMKVSLVEPSKITAAANALIDANAGIIEQAKTNLAERDNTGISSMIDIKSLIPISEAKLAKAEAKKSQSGLSAKQAGMVKHRAKPAEAHH